MNWTRPLTDILAVAAFFSRLPFWSVRARLAPDAPAEPLGKLAWCFPLAGLLVALPGAVAAIVLGHISLAPLVEAALLTVIALLVTGALHEDGLADVCDGFGGGSSRERKLEIMRDSTIGTYGAAGLGMALLLRVASLSALIVVCTPLQIALILLTVAAASRTAMLFQWSTQQPARMDGLAKSQAAPSRRGSYIALMIAGVVTLSVLLPISGLDGTAVTLGLSLIAVWAFCRICSHQVGGYTGDTLGAGQQIVEVCMLVCLSATIGVAIP